MKRRTVSSFPVRQPMYPNAADANYFAEKALEILTAVVSGTGAVTIMLLLVAMA